MTFRMTLDRCQRTLTYLVLLVVPLSALTMLMATRRPLPAAAAVVATLVALGLGAAFAPAAVELEGRQLRVLRRAAGPVTVSVDDVVAVEAGPDCCDLKLFGSSGFLGRFGLFWTLGFGGHWLYATRRGPALALRRRRGLPLVLVVDEGDRFRDAVAEWRLQHVQM
jgi:hypothetical protein